MTGSNAPGRARWIVVTPTPEWTHWRDAIASAAQKAGLRLVSADAFAAADAATVILTDNAALAIDAGAQTVTAVLPDPEAAAMRLPDETDEDYLARIRRVSSRLAAACSLDVHHPVIGADSLARQPEPLALFADLVIDVPGPAKLAFQSDHDKAFAAVLRLYRGGRPVPGMPASEWAWSVFECDKRSLLGPACDLDLTGRPRFLIFGPYIALPPGRWSANIRFSVDEAACSRQFRLDWGTPAAWADQLFIPGRPGVYEMELAHQWSTAADAEVRFLVMEGCFSGAVSFMGATITRIEDVVEAAIDPIEDPVGTSEI